MTKKKSIILTLGQFFCIILLILGITSSTWGDQSDYNGTYAGTYSGNTDNGYWVAIADTTSSLYAFLTYSTTNSMGDFGLLIWSGESNGIGHYYSEYTTIIQGSSVDAYINSVDGSVEGIWSNGQTDDGGTLEGNELTSSDYAGTYSGTFIGDDSGTWTLTIASNGYITGTLTSDSSGSTDFEGGCHPEGYILVIGEDNTGVGVAVFGQISGSSISGLWIADDESSGTFTGSSSEDDDSSCFILSLTNK